MFKLNQFPPADQLVLNTARSVGFMPYALVLPTSDGKALLLRGVATSAAHLQGTGQVVPLDHIEGL